jgi:hypothetical protein
MIIHAKINRRKYQLKRCSKCGFFLPLSEYNRDTQRADGLQRYCRECSNDYGRFDYDNKKDTYFERNKKRAELMTALPNTLTTAEYAQTLDYFNYRCALTGDAKNISQEHFIAVTTGHAGTTAENIIPMRQDLNASKHAHNPFEWILDAEDHYGLDVRKWNSLLAYLAFRNKLSIEEYVAFVNWCYANPRTAEEAAADLRPSVQIWQEER